MATEHRWPSLVTSTPTSWAVRATGPPVELCALSTAEAVSLQFGVAVEEKPSIDEADQSGCNWALADDPAAQSPMRISQTAGFTSEALGGDEPIDIAGADLAAYSANLGGGAHVDAVVGDQLLEIVFPVGTEGAREFGLVIASLWVASQS